MAGERVTGASGEQSAARVRSRSLSLVDAEKLAVVRRWHDDHEKWKRTGKGPDGTTFPPAWPLSHIETDGLIYALAWLANGVADDLNTWQIVNPENRDVCAETARQIAGSVPRMEVTP